MRLQLHNCSQILFICADSLQIICQRYQGQTGICLRNAVSFVRNISVIAAVAA